MFDAGNSPSTAAAPARRPPHRRGAPDGPFVLSRMFRSVHPSTPFWSFVLGLLGLRLPQPVYTVAGMFGQANAFLAMLIGLLTRIPQESRSDVLRVVLLVPRFGLAASAVRWMLPLPAGIRQVLALEPSGAGALCPGLP